MQQNVTISFTPESLEYHGPDVNQTFAGEDDPMWCERCQTHHRRGAPPEVERERIIQKLAKQVAARIEADVLAEFT
jgi:hypothetical protein